MDKAMEAAAAMHVRMRYDNIVRGPKEYAAEVIRAYLSALKEDPEVVERVGRAMLADELATRPHRDFDETWAQEDLIWLSNARAALSALEME